MTTVTPRTPSGFPEYLPAEQLEFNRLLSIVRDTYQLYGFSPLDTPDLELSDILLTKTGGETEQQVYRFTKGSNDLTMRFDLTVPLARYVAEHEGQLVFPFRRYQIGKVHRGERAQAGRFREFYQCDIDVVGSTSPLVDAEFPAVINDIFEQFQFGKFTIYLNNRLVLAGFLEGVGLADKSAEVLRVIDKIDKLTPEEFAGELKRLSLTDQQVERIAQVTSITGSNDEIINQLRALVIESDKFADGVDKLERLIAALRQLAVPEHRFLISLRIARGLDYYTGTVYETVLDDHPEVGSICSGGRYDSLAGHYTTTELPGVGISIGLSRLFYQMQQLGLAQASAISPAEIMVAPIDQAQTEAALRVAQILRQAGKNVLFYSEPTVLKKKFRYADRMGFKWVALIGEDEAAAGTASLKNMQTGESTTVAVDAVAGSVSE